MERNMVVTMTWQRQTFEGVPVRMKRDEFDVRKWYGVLEVPAELRREWEADIHLGRSVVLSDIGPVGIREVFRAVVPGTAARARFELHLGELP